MARLLSDLTILILSFFPLKRLQLLQEEWRLPANWFRTMLRHRYQLTTNQLANAWAPVNANSLTPAECFVSVCTNSGETGFQQELYTTINIALIQAIQANDPETFLHHLLRTKKTDIAEAKGEVGIPLSAGVIVFLAIRTGNMELVALLDCFLYSIGAQVDLNTNDFNDLMDYASTIKKIMKNSLAIFPDPNALEYLQTAAEPSMQDDFSLLAYNFDFADGLALLLRVVEPTILTGFLHPGSKIEFPTDVEPEPRRIITHSFVQRCQFMIPVIKEYFIDSPLRQLYLAKLNILTGQPLGFDIAKSDVENLPSLVALTLSVLNMAAMVTLLPLAHGNLSDYFDDNGVFIILSEVIYQPTAISLIDESSGNIVNDIMMSLTLTHQKAVAIGYQLPRTPLEKLRHEIKNGDYPDLKMIQRYPDAVEFVDTAIDQLNHLTIIPPDIALVPATYPLHQQTIQVYPSLAPNVVVNVTYLLIEYQKFVNSFKSYRK